jgi:hypothetical protein
VRAESAEQRVEEETQPDALPFALDADQVHAVVPVARTHERQAVCTEVQCAFDRQRAMPVQARRLRRTAGRVVVGLLLGGQRAAFEEMHLLVQHRGVAGQVHVAADRQRQPQVIVGTARAHPASTGWMPPVLDVTLRVLACRAAQQVFAHQGRLRVHQGHRILQLVAKSECTPRLVVAAAGPEAAGERLVRQPAVGECIDDRVRRTHLDRAQRPLPVLPDALQRQARRAGLAQPQGQGTRRLQVLAGAEAEDDLAFLAIGQVEGHPDRTAGIERGTEPARQQGPGHGFGIAEAAVASDELVAVATQGA